MKGERKPEQQEMVIVDEEEDNEPVWPY